MAQSISRRDLLLSLTGVAASLALPKTALATTSLANAATSHRIIEANGVGLHVAEQGEGPLVLLCHGFPECWYSWRYQLPVLAANGFHAVALDFRGFGRSERPKASNDYTIMDDISDVVGLVDALGEKQAILIGHDIGATIAWQAAVLHPDRFRAVIALSAPFRPRGFGVHGPPTSLMPRTNDTMFYQLFLQSPQAQGALEANLRRTFRSMFYALSGDGQAALSSSGLGAGMVPATGPAFSDPPSLPRWISDDDIRVYIEEYKRSTFRGPLAWYRNLDRSWELLSPYAERQVTVPALYVAGDRDFVARAFASAIPRQAEMVPRIRPGVSLPGCGHWTQQERPDEVNAAVVTFLQSISS